MFVRLTALAGRVLDVGDSFVNRALHRDGRRSACSHRDLLSSPPNASRFINLLSGVLLPASSRALRELVGVSTVALTTLGQTAPHARHEYVLLLRQQCRARKLLCNLNFKHMASCLAVAKANSDRQREVWDGSSLSTASARPPPPPWLASQADLAALESSTSQPLLVSVRDGQSFSG